MKGETKMEEFEKIIEQMESQPEKIKALLNYAIKLLLEEEADLSSSDPSN